MRISSSAFRDGEHIPRQYSRFGEDKSPPLRIEDVPADAKSLALMVLDPDAPGKTFTHWLVFDLDPKTVEIGEDHAPEMARQGTNDFGEVQYGGPQPPFGEHHYIFHAYAIDKKLDLPRGARREAVERAMKDHVLAEAEMVGLYAAEGRA